MLKSMMEVEIMVKMFFVIKHHQVLRNPKNHKEGFVNNESFHITKNLSKRDNTEASVILDIANQKIIKNRFEDRTFEELFKYAAMHYADYINKWTQTNSYEA
jgi:hypothetical protein